MCYIYLSGRHRATLSNICTCVSSHLYHVGPIFTLVVALFLVSTSAMFVHQLVTNVCLLFGAEQLDYTLSLKAAAVR